MLIYKQIKRHEKCARYSTIKNTQVTIKFVYMLSTHENVNFENMLQKFFIILYICQNNSIKTISTAYC